MKEIDIDGQTVPFTHMGWFGICPVYIAYLDSDCPMIYPRHWVFIPVAWISEAAFGVYFFVRGWIDWDYTPMWRFKVTGKL